MSTKLLSPLLCLFPSVILCDRRNKKLSRVREYICFYFFRGLNHNSHIIIDPTKMAEAGCATSSTDNFCIERILNTQENQNIVHDNRFSLVGSSQQEVNVGIDPVTTTIRLMTTVAVALHNGQRQSPIAAPVRHILSIGLHPGRPNFMARVNTIQTPHIIPTVWPLITPWESIPKNITVSRIAQMIHVALIGLVSFLKMAVMYG